MWTSAISMPRTRKGIHGSYMGLPQLQHHPVVQHTPQTQCRSGSSVAAAWPHPTGDPRLKTGIVLPVFRRQAPTTAGAVLLGKTQLQLDRPLIPRPYRNFHSFLSLDQEAASSGCKRQHPSCSRSAFSTPRALVNQPECPTPVQEQLFPPFTSTRQELREPEPIFQKLVQIAAIHGRDPKLTIWTAVNCSFCRGL
jgi:hypothetical protein